MTEKMQFTCKLTSKELQARKATIIAGLKRQVLEKRDLANGFAYKFEGSDAMIDELSAFIKTERRCCNFFDFSLEVKGGGAETWLHISGPDGAREFIASELGF